MENRLNKDIKLGLIGISEGNGHPYSWSSIFNGYDRELMEKCGFPIIPRYLEKQNFPEDQILGAKVTHIWTQNTSLSEKIAKTTNIENIINDPKKFIGSVDAVLLARDDAEISREMAHPILEAGIPIYIDKPLALTVNGAKKLILMQKYEGQIFSCSALRYDSNLRLTEDQKKTVGQICSIHATVSKDWDKYAVHVIEPLLQLIPNRGALLKSQKWISNDQTSLFIEYENKINVHIHTSGKSISPLSLRVIGVNGWTDLFHNDTFKAFKIALQEFILAIKNKEVRIPSQQTLDVVELIELGRKI